MTASNHLPTGQTINAEMVCVDGAAPKAPTSLAYGPIIGQYMDSPIYDYLTDNFGIKRIFKGVVSKGIKAFVKDSIIIHPGLLYEPV